MTPVDQTIFGGEKGNCFAACVASLTGVPIGEVPNFCADGDEWWNALARWLKERGWYALQFEGRPHPLCFGYCIVSGPAARGYDHATIWLHGELVHDPHPSRAGLLEVKDTIVLIPIDPQPLFGNLTNRCLV